MRTSHGPTAFFFSFFAEALLRSSFAWSPRCLCDSRRSCTYPWPLPLAAIAAAMGAFVPAAGQDATCELENSRSGRRRSLGRGTKTYSHKEYERAGIKIQEGHFCRH